MIGGSGRGARSLLLAFAAVALAALVWAGASAAGAPPTVHLHARYSAASGLEVTGKVDPVPQHAMAALETRRGKGKWVRRTASQVAANGSFSLRLALAGGAHRLLVRVSIVRGRHLIGRSSKKSVAASRHRRASSPAATAGRPLAELRPGERLAAGESIGSPNGAYRLIMQTDGNLVLYHGGAALWSSQTDGYPGAFAVMQEDGNLVVYDGGTALWNSSTWGFPGAVLQLQDDSNLVIYQLGHPVWDWPSGYLGDELNQWRLQPGAYLFSHNHEYRLIMQGDGNLVLYRGGSAIWSSGTSGDNGAYAVMQTDGNLVVYLGGVAKWSSNTSGFPGAYLRLQDDSNAVIYQDGHPVWDWGSGYLGNQLDGWKLQPGAYLLSSDYSYRLIMQGDGNLVLYHGGTALWSSQTDGDTGASAVMQPDGNLVVYSDGVARWNSGTAGFPGSRLLLQDDSNLVIYQGGTAVWDWGSGKLVGGGGSPGTGERILDEAAKWAGRPYCFDGGGPGGPSLGTTDPENGLRCGTTGYDPSATPGFDCTGLTVYAVYQVTGKVLAHSGAQATNAVAQGGQHIGSQSELQPGDLVYFGGSFGSFVHAGVYAGVVNGKPSFWSAVTEGIGVALEPMAWETSALPFVGAVRF